MISASLLLAMPVFAVDELQDDAVVVTEETTEEETFNETKIEISETNIDVDLEQDVTDPVDAETEFDKTEVEIAYSVEDVAQMSSAAHNQGFFTIDTSEGNIDETILGEELKQEISEAIEPFDPDDEKVDTVLEYLEDSELYAVESVDETDINVVSIFANRRLMLDAGYEDQIQAFGATRAVYYNDHYYLEYDSEDEACLAYKNLSENYGADSLIIDLPVRTLDSGWGGGYIRSNVPLSRPDEYSGTVKVAIIDTGINADHAVFKGKKIVDPFNVVYDEHGNENGETEEPLDHYGHGTAVAGVIAQNTPDNVEIMPVKVMNSSDDGSLLDMCLGAERAYEQGADIINMSLGAPLLKLEEGETEAMARAIYYLLEVAFDEIDALVITASGNEGDNQCDVLFVPAALDSTISVGAIDSNGSRWSKSNYGENLDFVAPGVGCRVAFSPVGTGTMVSRSGTSLAAPYITSIAAILKAKDTTLSDDEIYQTMIDMSKDLGEKGYDFYYGNGCPTFDGEELILVKEIKLEKSSLNIEIGKTANVNTTALPENATNRSVSYTSSNTNIAAVGNDGKITAKKAGTANIMVSANDGSDAKAILKVTVKEPETQTTTKKQPVLVTAVTLDKTSLKLEEGKTATLKVKLSPANAENKKITYQSSNTNVAAVDSTGKVTAKSAGKAKVTAKAADGSNKSAVCSIEVVKKQQATTNKQTTTKQQSTTAKKIKGWYKTGGKTYYYNTSYKKVTGWNKIGGRWYYFDKNGVMLTGWQTIGKNRYYLGTDGKMVNGWFKNKSKWYYLGYEGSPDTGLMRTGWLKQGGSWYLLGKDGIMKTSWQKSGGKWYYLYGGSGKMAVGWLKQGGSWYYLNSSGVMVTGGQYIGGRYYRFASDGKWIS